MREEILIDKDNTTMLQDEDTRRKFSYLLSRFTEYMHWHYKFSHPSHIVMTKMAKQYILPRITIIVTNTPGCLCAMTVQLNTPKESYPGEVISVDEPESSKPDFIGQMTGKLTKQHIVACTVFVDHASNFSYVYHKTSMTSEETLKSKLAFEIFHQHMEYTSNITMLIKEVSKTTFSPKSLKKKLDNKFLWSRSTPSKWNSREKNR
jgi:hypothetical protein